MAKSFALGADDNHRVGDRACPSCEENYPEGCACGGLIHAAATNDEDADGNRVLATACDVCGRSDEELDEP
jgi:hypothetical protein